LSGCGPEIEITHVRSAASDWSPETEAVYGPLINASLSALLDVDELQRQSNLTVIGAIHADGTPMFTNGFSRQDALSVRDDDIRIIPHCFQPNHWLSKMPLPILRLATGNRMTPNRVWRLAIRQGRHDRGLSGIDYGEIMLRGVQYPLLFPGLHPQPTSTSSKYLVVLTLCNAF
ncbi:hypothetical protein BJ138DRAFT_999860, partial [Hygrophoropsis aurantiaca]